MELHSVSLELQASLAAQKEMNENVEQYKAIAAANDAALTQLSKAS